MSIDSEQLSIFALGSEFSCLETTKELVDMLYLVDQRLQTSPVKDADRAGERLLVVAARERLDAYEWRSRFEIRGEATGTAYGSLSLVIGNPAGHLGRESCANIELLVTVLLRASLNGSTRFSPAERQALSDGYSQAVGNGHAGPISCNNCEHTFLFFDEALAHESACAV